MRLLLSVAVATFAAHATATETCDTVAVVDQPTKISITQGPDGYNIAVNGCKDDASFRLDYETASNNSDDTNAQDWFIKPPFAKMAQNAKPRRNPCYEGLSDIYFGWVTAHDGTPGFNRTGVQGGMLNVANIAWQRSKQGPRLTLGLGWQFEKMPVGQNMTLARGDNGELLTVPVPVGHYGSKASINLFAIQLPFLFSFNIYSDFAMEFGAIGMLNTDARASCSWKEDGNISSKKSFKHLHQRILTYDTYLRIGWRGCLAAYARYSPMNRFSKEFGPQYRSVAIGISAGF